MAPRKYVPGQPGDMAGTDPRWRVVDTEGNEIAVADANVFPVQSATGLATVWALKVRDSAGLPTATLVNDARGMRRSLDVTVIWPAGTPVVPPDITTPDEMSTSGGPAKMGFIPDGDGAADRDGRD